MSAFSLKLGIRTPGVGDSPKPLPQPINNQQKQTEVNQQKL